MRKSISKSAVLVACAAAALASTQSKASDTIRHRSCDLVLASGPDYSFSYGDPLPMEYRTRVKDALADKGYNVIFAGEIGTYVENGSWRAYAVQKEAFLLTFRSLAPTITVRDGTEYSCVASFELLTTDKESPSARIASTGYQSPWTTWIPLSFLCHGVINGVIGAIPDCEKTDAEN